MTLDRREALNDAIIEYADDFDKWGSERRTVMADVLEALDGYVGPMLRVLSEVRWIHSPILDGRGVPWCLACSGPHGADETRWPCETVLALDSINDEEGVRE